MKLYLYRSRNRTYYRANLYKHIFDNLDDILTEDDEAAISKWPITHERMNTLSKHSNRKYIFSNG